MPDQPQTPPVEQRAKQWLVTYSQLDSFESFGADIISDLLSALSACQQENTKLKETCHSVLWGWDTLTAERDALKLKNETLRNAWKTSEHDRNQQLQQVATLAAERDALNAALQGVTRYTITGEGASKGYFRLVEDKHGAWVTWAEVEALASLPRPAEKKEPT